MKVVVNGVTYSVEVCGKGHPVVLLHGFTGSLDNWKTFVSMWKSRFTLILVDIIGHGKSEAPADYKRYSMENVVADLACLLDALKVEKTHLVGYSMGGRLALSFAVTYPDRLKKIVLESTSPGLQTEKEREARRKNDEALANKLEKLGIEKFVDEWEDIPLFSSQKSLASERLLRLREQRLLNNPFGLANSLRGMGTGAQPSWWSELAKINHPTLLLCGELDKKFCEIAEKVCTLMPHSTIKKVKDAGHAIHVEKPKFFGKIVSEFLCKEER